MDEITKDVTNIDILPNRDLTRSLEYKEIKSSEI